MKGRWVAAAECFLLSKPQAIGGKGGRVLRGYSEPVEEKCSGSGKSWQRGTTGD